MVGLARSGVAAALTLKRLGEDVLGVDAGALAAADADALRDAGVEAHPRADGAELLERARTVVKSPGVPADAPLITAARDAGLPVLGELELAWRMLANEFIAVTGTNGKTTTVELIGHIHRAAGLPVAVAGNVGVALSGLVGQLDPSATVVCEASSFQLEDTSAFAPEAAVLLNLTPDHIDRHGTIDAYLLAKLEAFTRQTSEDLAVAPLDFAASVAPLGLTTSGVPLGSSSGGVPPTFTSSGERTGGAPRSDVLPGAARRVCFGRDPRAELSEHDGRLWWAGEHLLALDELRLRGAHNVDNAMAAAAVCLARGIDIDAVRAGLRSFAGVAHRLEEVATRDDVLYVNDSKATNVASTLVALQAFAHADPESQALAAHGDSTPRVHLILGGQGKGQDFTPLREPVSFGCRAVYLIGEDTPVIAAALAGAPTPVHECGDLSNAVAHAAAAADAGEVVLLSPGCASFDQFTDFEARGDAFRELVLE